MLFRSESQETGATVEECTNAMMAQGGTAEQVRKAHVAVANRLLERQKSIRAVLVYLDSDGSNSITRDEIYKVCKTFHLLKYKDPKGKIKGDLSIEELDSMLDVVDMIAGAPSDEPGTRVDIEAFAQGVFSTDVRGELIDILEVAGLVKPVDDSITANQGIVLNFDESACRAVFRISGIC